MHSLKCVLLFFLASLSVSAQQSAPGNASTSPAANDPQTVALIQRSLAALTGGVPVSDVTLAGTARRIAGSDDETGTATVTAMPGGYSKLSLSFPSGPRVEIRNPAGSPLPDSAPAGMLPANPPLQPVGAWSGSDGVLHGVATHNVVTDATWFFPAFTLANILSGNHLLSAIDQETLDGQSVLHISALQQFTQVAGKDASANGVVNLLQHLSQLDIYIDPVTSLPVAFAFNTHPDGDALIDIPVRVQFSGYQVLSGAQVPLHVQKFINNGLALDLTFSNPSLNSGLGASSFQLQ
jgi:hypothetical protein